MKRKETIIILMLVLSPCTNLPVAVGQQRVVTCESEAEFDTKKGLKLVKNIKPWTAERIKIMEDPNDLPGITTMTLSPNGKLLAWGDEQDNVFLWFSQDDRLVIVKDTTVTKPPADPHFHFPVESIRFIQDDVLFWMDFEQDVRRADIKEGKVSVKPSAPPSPRTVAMRAVITPDSFILCTGRGKNVLVRLLLHPHEYELKKYDLETGKYQGTCRIYPRNKGCYHHVNVMALSPDDSLVAIASDNKAGLVKLRDFKLIQTFDVQGGTTLAISPDNSLVAVNSGWEGYKVFDTRTGKPVRTITEISYHSDSPDCFAFENQDILWFHSGWELYRLNIKSGEMRLIWERQPEVKTMFLDRNSQCLYFGGTFDGTIRIYELP